MLLCKIGGDTSLDSCLRRAYMSPLANNHRVRPAIGSDRPSGPTGHRVRPPFPRFYSHELAKYFSCACKSFDWYLEASPTATLEVDK
ncbi:hypothetical protein CCR75_009331 [Bremia lactucae]|uniref:Uncharacterized protein n=1 Tax=Bremia lactucae TaxID=4779 RepID=A0A976FQN7_BRELC|nr:hypothetical protein CCR75_009331 [Bremia lactucae]